MLLLIPGIDINQGCLGRTGHAALAQVGFVLVTC